MVHEGWEEQLRPFPTARGFIAMSERFNRFRNEDQEEEDGRLSEIKSKISSLKAVKFREKNNFLTFQDFY